MPRFSTTGDKLKELLKLMGMCNNYVKLQFKPDRLVFTSIDPSRTCMLVGSVNPKTAFSDYCGDGEDVFIDVKDFDTVLKRLKKNNASFVAEMGEITVKEKNTTWTVGMLEDCDNPPMPNLTTTNSFTIPTTQFEEEAVRAMDGGDVLVITMSEDKVTMVGKDDYKKGITTEIPKSELNDFHADAPGSSSFAKSFVEDALKVIPKETTLKIGIDESYPMVMEIITPDDSYKAKLFLAPRIMEDDDI